MDKKKIIVFISGPSGSGKTSLVKELLDTYDCYIEDFKGNKYLKKMLEGEREFNSYKSQYWFFNSMYKYIIKNKEKKIIVIDQDPYYILNVYSIYFGNMKSMTQKEFLKLKKIYEQICNLYNFDREKHSIYLKSNTETLYKRIKKRDGKALDLKWFENINKMFEEKKRKIETNLEIKTEDFSIKNIKEKVESYIENIN
jgi:deoxyadenosine/deoxycytidine kinase